MVCAYQLLIQGLVLVAQWVSWKRGPDNVFHISQLKKCPRVPTEATGVEEINLQPDLSYTKHPLRILDEAERKF